MTTYDLVPGTHYNDHIVLGNLDAGGSSSFNVRELTTGVYSITDEIVLICDASGGDVIINLPTIASAPRRFYLFKKTNLTNLVTLTTTGGNTINGGFTYDILTDISIEIINAPTGNDWTILSNINATVTPIDNGLDAREFRIVSGAGQNPAVNLTISEISIASNATGILADGVLGQNKEIHIVEITGGTYTLTLNDPVSASTLFFDTVGQGVTLRYTARGWIITGGGGAILT